MLWAQIRHNSEVHQSNRKLALAANDLAERESENSYKYITRTTCVGFCLPQTSIVQACSHLMLYSHRRVWFVCDALLILKLNAAWVFFSATFCEQWEHHLHSDGSHYYGHDVWGWWSKKNLIARKILQFGMPQERYKTINSGEIQLQLLPHFLFTII